tara:strand:- start:131 stop:439 length:309 start_codon:yes stop_codon:yes gene_type:complete
MDNLIKLTEIYELKNNMGTKRANQTHKNYSIRNIYVNPSYVVLIRENIKYKNLLEGDSLVEGLDNRQEFTQITLASDSRSTHQVTVVGAPESVFEKILKRKK